MKDLTAYFNPSARKKELHGIKDEIVFNFSYYSLRLTRNKSNKMKVNKKNSKYFKHEPFQEPKSGFYRSENTLVKRVPKSEIEVKEKEEKKLEKGKGKKKKQIIIDEFDDDDDWMNEVDLDKLENENAQVEESKEAEPEIQIIETKTKIKSSPAKIKTPKKSPAKEEKVEEPEEHKKQGYKQFMSRSGPIAPGSKQLPEGEPDCLQNLTFVFTGDLDSTSRDEATDLVKRYGGRVTSAVSSRTSYLVVGRDPGETKIKKAKEMKTNILDEDGLFDLVVKNSEKMKAKINPITKSTSASKVEDMKQPQKLQSYKSAPEVAPVKKENAGNELWTVKYKPKSLKDIIGNQSHIASLEKWIQSWNKDLKTNRACLISGPPGIGKTTAAHLVAKDLGFEVLELNASDARNKSSLDNSILELIGNHSIDEFFKKTNQSGKEKKAHKHLIIMDEVDGMGGGDRGGMAELIKLIKKSKIPIICICNDRQNPKVRSLVNYCLDLRFIRPSAQQVRSRIMTIAHREGFSIETNAIDQLVQGSQSDIRQVLNTLQTWNLCQNKMTYDDGKRLSEQVKKNVEMGPFDLAGRLFNPSLCQSMKLDEKLELYFNDYQLVPLFIQENYLKMKPNLKTAPKKAEHVPAHILSTMALAADSLSISDLTNAQIYGSQEFSLLPVHAIFSTIIPTYVTMGQMSERLSFPALLGQMSKANKGKRLLGELWGKMRTKINVERQDVRQNYFDLLIHQWIGKLAKEGQDAIPDVIDFMTSYSLSREDLEPLEELSLYPLPKIESTVKSAFTRAYNKSGILMAAGSVHIGPVSKKQKTVAVDFEEAIEQDEEEVEDEENDEELGKQKFITEKKPKAAAKSKAAPKRKAASTSEPKSRKKK